LKTNTENIHTKSLIVKPMELSLKFFDPKLSLKLTEEKIEGASWLPPNGSISNLMRLSY
jgi:hypothetical protein